VPDYPHHLSGFEYIGLYRYFLTFCTFERNAYFTDALWVRLAIGQFLRASAEQAIGITTYCFMPDHVHLLVQGTRDDADLKAFAGRAKQYSGFYFRRQAGKTLWQRYGYERVLRKDEDTVAVAKYIINNPLRAGIVKDVMQYPFWGSGMYSREALIDYVSQAG
jgi:putative transposase